MGHTVYPMRYIIYEKMQQLRKLANGMREPERSTALGIINSIYLNISAISYLNPLPYNVMENVLFATLIQEKTKHNLDVEEFALYLFTLMVTFKVNKLKNPDERNLNRLLQKAR